MMEDIFYILQSCDDGFYITKDIGYTASYKDINIKTFETSDDAEEFSKEHLSELETFNIIECTTTRKVIKTIN